MAWTTRDLTVAEAARIVGLSRKHLDVIISRNRTLDVLFSEKRKGRRWFSIQDVAVLRIAFELERAGRSWLMAIAAAAQNLRTPPAADALLVAPAVMRRACGSPRIISDRDVPRLKFDVSTIVIPIGSIVQSIVKEAADVAIQ
ncbi:MAG: hypothetical protein KUA43_08575 [Hoeflea sp.]|uniref:hypothetical protein n=1 Tax=Hoeflea sp. TaxID=1940281 RepID=UPI001D4A9D4B|nr:hypothetical protein [Hoeflea sp.]MBU4529719.1 hypothetical protein [Alphaproteobacteria bacterium]MBU4543280.1 hypothetical protein [Alphaproteobacteria bacterium]MBU4552467.1 hypothetical protein [Alphaproteobacteria bacterium]MBV1723483.1 hypothetical protein [Hoeflea sp.]MBV1762932.1 hypothetical protein [Hoeflea sp.]